MTVYSDFVPAAMKPWMQPSAFHPLRDWTERPYYGVGDDSDAIAVVSLPFIKGFDYDL